MPVTIAGATGIESPAYSQGGDPVVESGSNTDGEWTRWADGTQLVRGDATAASTETSANPIYRSVDASITFPQPFIDSGVDGAGNAKGSIGRWANVHSITATGMSLRQFNNDSNAGVNVAGYVATGRWK